MCLLLAMHGLAALLFPAVLMLFALAMERMERQVDENSAHREEVEDFLAGAAGAAGTDALPVPAVDELAGRRDTIEFDVPSSFGHAVEVPVHRAG
jgi:hypothetical protein